MKIAIIGSRAYPEQSGKSALMTLFASFAPGTEIVSGGAKGPDKWAEELAMLFDFPCTVHRPQYNTDLLGGYDKGATFKRNRQIVEESDLIVAFWDGESKGTAYTIEFARNAGKPVFITSPR